MSPNNFFVLTALSCSVFGLSFMLLPELMADLHGATEITAFTKLVMRLFAVVLISTAIMAYSVRNAKASDIRKSIFLFLFLLDVFTSTLNIFYMIQVTANPINWLELIVTLSFGSVAFYLWMKG